MRSDATQSEQSEIKNGRRNVESNEWLVCLRHRLQELQNSSHDNSQYHATLKRASILVLLDSQGNILFNQRSMHLKSHPGEICFPGGKQDPSDLQHQSIHPDIFTALRECHEEVGLQFDICPFDETNATTYPHLEILGLMPTLESKHHLCVTPIIAMTDLHHNDLQLKINVSEVDAAFWAPLHFFVQNTPEQLIPFPWKNETFWYRNYSYLNSTINHNESTSVSNSREDKQSNNKKQKKKSKNDSYNITGLTAHIAYELAQFTFPSNGHTLFRLIDGRRPYWSVFYYDFSTNVLHQYDHQWQCQRKQCTATKKNRLPLGDCKMVDYEDSEYCHAFQLIVLDGRIIWTLAALTQKDKAAFRQKLLVIAVNS